MRYPVGYRPTLSEAVDAATEAATMTGLRYRVRPAPDAAPELGVWDAFAFAPVNEPTREDGHMPVRV